MELKCLVSANGSYRYCIFVQWFLCVRTGDGYVTELKVGVKDFVKKNMSTTFVQNDTNIKKMPLCKMQ